MTLCAYAITILHERWMQDTPTSHCVIWEQFDPYIRPLLKIGISETPELKALTSQLIRIVTLATTCSYITYTLVYCKGTDIGIKLFPDYTV